MFNVLVTEKVLSSQGLAHIVPFVLGRSFVIKQYGYMLSVGSAYIYYHRVHSSITWVLACFVY